MTKEKLPEHCSSDMLFSMINAFTEWLQHAGYKSYDPYDLWGTPFGIFSRRLYYKNKYAGLPFILPILLLDTFFPSSRKLFLKKQRFATADAQLLLGFINLYQITHKDEYLIKAKELANDLLKSSIPGYSGHCWGYPFDWQNSEALWRKNTPFITATPYCFEAFLELFQTTQDKQYLDIFLSIAKFVFTDLKDTQTSTTAAAGSYSPIDESKVINASAYRAMVLIEASEFLGDKPEFNSYRNKAWQNINFILENQNKDGSWFYGIGRKKERFIDHFHTCFVLKNLKKINVHLNDNTIKNAIISGYQYYRKNLYDSSFTPLTFAIQPRTQIVKLDLYNFAEAITLGSLLLKEIPESFRIAQKLALSLHHRYQLPKGYFVTKVFKGGLTHKTPFLRWPQAQLFYALTNLLKASQ